MERNETMEVDSGTPGDQEAMPPRGPNPDDELRDDDSFGSAASQHDDESLDDDGRPHAATAMPAHAMPHQSRHAEPTASDDDASDDDDEEEAECRVCRGPAEEG